MRRRRKRKINNSFLVGILAALVTCCCAPSILGLARESLPQWTEIEQSLSLLLRELATAFAAAIVLVILSALLLLVWRRNQRMAILAATQDIYSLGPYEFEEYVGILFKKTGFKVRHMGQSGDRGIDLAVKKNGKVAIVQCKRYQHNVGPGIVRELIGTMANAKANQGYLVTPGGFTAGARQEARTAGNISLIGGKTLVRWARRHGLPGEIMQ